MTRSRLVGRAGRLLALLRAEFVKVWASRVPLAFLLTIPALTYAFVFEFYHVEHAADHVRIRHAAEALPLLYFMTSKTLVFQAAVVAFAAYWATVDSQYGMIRVACTQPVSRVEYLFAKWAGIAAHVTLFSLTSVASHVAWTAAYSGVGAMDATAWLNVLRFAWQVTTFTVALAGVAMATASCRRTVGSGLVTAVMAVIALALMTMLPFDVLAPRFVFVRYFFFPLGEFPNPWPLEDSPFVRLHTTSDFLRVVIGTPLLTAVPAALYFARRDISE